VFLAIREHVVCKENAEDHHGQIRQISTETGEVCNASTEAGHAQERIRRASAEPEAGHRHRSQRSEAKRRKGAAQVIAVAIAPKRQRITLEVPCRHAAPFDTP